ncbi:hypothetical protein GL218_00779 [Daldinia childiae]|uniref:uncharacterized protein n=1 Tax=Daldinia childiae TaxID=326645 RepID=UPI0014474FAA|nr:uncharacterized protein GL218_00779 [Daldinia childiae]KAF3070952.1 hypothetical protein GL218_00779 [Daldinia childiae]
MSTTAVVPTPCANWKDGGSVCSREGTLVCGGCKLILYCSRHCQVKHWSEHKKECKSPLSKPTWLPAWDRERRDPAWSRGEAATNLHNTFGPNKHLWGNTPAMDVLQLPRNEGPAYDKDVDILFAASGDVRNAVQTIRNLPPDFKHQVKMTINDRDFDITARNAIILLLALSSLEGEPDQPDFERLAETLIHVWYSAALTKDTLSELRSRVKPLINEACERTVDKQPDIFVGKEWVFKSGSSLLLVLKKEDWARVLEFLDVPEDLTLEKSRKIRQAITLAPEREDYRDRWYFKDASPSMRVAKQRYREDGLLLAFGHPRIGFDYPNPTLFQTVFQTISSWPMAIKQTPSVAGLSTRSEQHQVAFPKTYTESYSPISAASSAPFLRRVATGKIHFELFNVNATELIQRLMFEEGSYDRIEASNISDKCWLGTRETLRHLSPLLKTPAENPHATLITVYLNAVMETVRGSDQEGKGLDIARIRKYLTNIQEISLMRNLQGAEMYRIWDARSFTLDADKALPPVRHGYMAANHFGDIEKDLHVVMKEQNTIGDAWPTALKLRPGQPGAQEEFNDALASSCTGVERINLTNFTSGFNNVVLELTFSDNVYWIARIPHQALDDGDRTSMLSEIATMKIIKKHTTIPIPQVFDFETSAEQPFGYPYIFTEYLRGRTLPNGLATTTIPHKYHTKVAKQLAKVFAELQNLTFSRIGRIWCGENADQPVEIMAMTWHASPGPLETSLEFFYNQRQGENREIIALHPNNPDWLTACWVMKTALSHIIIEDRVRGPFPLCHLDLHFGNMIFDNEYNLTGIIDWSSAQAAPLEQLSVCPELVTFPGLSDEENRPIVELKNLVVESLRELERDQEKKPRLDNPAVGVALDSNLTSLSTYMASKSAEVTYRQYMASPRGSLWAGQMIAKIIYGKNVTWEQLREVYGTTPLF